MSNFFGIILIIDGLLIITTADVTIALGVGRELESPMNYIVGLPEMLLGIYILYLNYTK